MNKKYIIDTDENKAFLKEMREELLAFGKNFPAPSGASYYLGDDGTPWKERPCETWITCRMSHVYSIGEMLGFSGAGELTDKALQGLTGILHDTENGGWFAGVNSDETIISGKQCYAHAFVLLAAASALLAGRKGADRLLDEALKLFEFRFWDEENGLTIDTWNTKFTAADDYRGLNANMHTVEAFLAVADATQKEKYRVRAGRIIDRVISWARENEWRIPEHYTGKWAPDLMCNKDKPDDQFKPYGATPGHGIEWARLIAQWAAATFDKANPNDAKKQELYFDAAQKLYCRAIEDAWNRDGAYGIVYTTDWDGTPVVHDRMHWTLAEAINTSAVLYRISQNARYADDYAMFWEYVDEKLRDHQNGSWFHQLSQNNDVLDTVWPGKPDLYHAFQATLIPYADVNVSVAKAVRDNASRFE